MICEPLSLIAIPPLLVQFQPARMSGQNRFGRKAGIQNIMTPLFRRYLLHITTAPSLPEETVRAYRAMKPVVIFRAGGFHPCRRV